jgi:hypothetical protein
MKNNSSHQAFLILVFYMILALGSADSSQNGDGNSTKTNQEVDRGSGSNKTLEDKVPVWVYGVYSGTAPGYDLLGEDGKPVYVFGEKVKVPQISRKVEINKDTDEILLRARSQDGSSYLSTAQMKITEVSNSKVVIDTSFDNGSKGTPTILVITAGKLEFKEMGAPMTELRKEQ